MRERIARTVSALALVLLVALGVGFARSQNRSEPAAPPVVGGEAAPAPTAAPAAPAPAAADSARGRVVFEEQGCTGCHSVAGVGSPRVPLDGVGARRSAASLRAWTTGAAALADSLAPGTLRVKQGYAAMPPADLDALVTFLASLKKPE